MTAQAMKRHEHQRQHAMHCDVLQELGWIYLGIESILSIPVIYLKDKNKTK